MTDARRSCTTGSKAAGAAGGLSRDDRLKAALKANMGRRKAQAKARQNGDRPGPPGGTGYVEDGSGLIDRQQDND
jgi:hypothetical protein